MGLPEKFKEGSPVKAPNAPTKEKDGHELPESSCIYSTRSEAMLGNLALAAATAASTLKLVCSIEKVRQAEVPTEKGTKCKYWFSLYAYEESIGQYCNAKFYLYKEPAPGVKNILHLQKRGGDSTTFSRLFRVVRAYVTTGLLPSPPPKPPQLPDEVKCPPQAIITWNAQQKMYVRDPRMQAEVSSNMLTTFANEANWNLAQYALVHDADTIRFIFETLNAKRFEVNYPTATCLKHFAEFQEAPKAFCLWDKNRRPTLLKLVFEQLENMDTCAVVKEQLARFLERLIQTYRQNLHNVV